MVEREAWNGVRMKSRPRMRIVRKEEVGERDGRRDLDASLRKSILLTNREGASSTRRRHLDSGKKACDSERVTVPLRSFVAIIYGTMPGMAKAAESLLGAPS